MGVARDNESKFNFWRITMSPEYVDFVGAVKLYFNNYANFKGRSTRSEFWWAGLAQLIILLALIILLVFVGGPFFYPTYGIMVLYGLAIVIPDSALSIRRLHDIGKSGWWLLINFVPFVGMIVFSVFAFLPSDGANKWGKPAKC